MEQFLAHWGYLAVFVLSFISSMGLPVGAEVAIIYGGVLASGQVVGVHHPLNLALVIIVATLAEVLGSLAGYSIGYFGGRALVDRVGKYVLLTHKDLDRAEAWFARRGEPFVLFGRFIPLLRSFVSFAAGLGEMALAKFVLFTVIGCAVWCTALTSLGYSPGQQLQPRAQGVQLRRLCGRRPRGHRRHRAVRPPVAGGPRRAGGGRTGRMTDLTTSAPDHRLGRSRRVHRTNRSKFRRRRILAVIIVLFVVFAAVVGPSLGSALTNPSLGSSRRRPLRRVDPEPRRERASSTGSRTSGTATTSRKAGGAPPKGAIKSPPPGARPTATTLPHLPAPAADRAAGLAAAARRGPVVAGRTDRRGEPRRLRDHAPARRGPHEPGGRGRLDGHQAPQGQALLGQLHPGRWARTRYSAPIKPDAADEPGGRVQLRVPDVLGQRRLLHRGPDHRAAARRGGLLRHHQGAGAHRRRSGAATLR